MNTESVSTLIQWANIYAKKHYTNLFEIFENTKFLHSIIHKINPSTINSEYIIIKTITDTLKYDIRKFISVENVLHKFKVEDECIKMLLIIIYIALNSDQKVYFMSTMYKMESRHQTIMCQILKALFCYVEKKKFKHILETIQCDNNIFANTSNHSSVKSIIHTHKKKISDSKIHATDSPNFSCSSRRQVFIKRETFISFDDSKLVFDSPKTMKSQIGEMEKQLKVLKGEIAKYQAFINELEWKVEDEQKLSKELNLKLEVKQREIDHFRREQEEKEGIFDKMCTSLDDCHEENIRLNSQIKKFQYKNRSFSGSARSENSLTEMHLTQYTINSKQSNDSSDRFSKNDTHVGDIIPHMIFTTPTCRKGDLFTCPISNAVESIEAIGDKENELKTKITKKIEEVKMATDRIDELVAKNEKQSNQIDKCNSEILKLKRLLNSNKTNSEKEIHDLNCNISKINTDLQRSSDLNIELQRDLNTVQGLHESQSTVLENRIKEIENMALYKSLMEAKARKLTAMNNELSTSMSELRTKETISTTLIKDLKLEIDKHLEAISELYRRLQRQELDFKEKTQEYALEVSDLLDKINNYESELADKKEMIVGNESALDLLLVEIQNLMATNEEMGNRLQVKDQEEMAYLAKLEELKDKEMLQLGEINTLKNDISILSTDKGKYHQEMENNQSHFQDTMQSLEAQMLLHKTDADSKAIERENEINRLHEELINADNRALCDRQEMEGEIEVLKMENSKLSSQILKLQLQDQDRKIVDIRDPKASDKTPQTTLPKLDIQPKASENNMLSNNKIPIKFFIENTPIDTKRQKIEFKNRSIKLDKELQPKFLSSCYSTTDDEFFHFDPFSTAWKPIPLSYDTIREQFSSLSHNTFEQSKHSSKESNRNVSKKNTISEKSTIDLNALNFKGNDFESRSERDRIIELNRRNTLVRPHLKTTYPVEVQFLEDSSLFVENQSDLSSSHHINLNKGSIEKNAYKNSLKENQNLGQRLLKSTAVKYLTPSKFMPSIRKTFRNKHIFSASKKTPKKFIETIPPRKR